MIITINEPKGITEKIIYATVASQSQPLRLSFDPSNFTEIADEQFDTASGLLPVEVFIWRMVAVFG